MQYRVYKLNPAGGIVSGEWIEAENEQDACTKAETFCGEGTPTVELWQGPRRIAVLPCHGKAA